MIEYQIVIDPDTTSEKIFHHVTYPCSQWSNTIRLAGEGRWNCRFQERYVYQENLHQPWVHEWKTIAEYSEDSRNVVMVGGDD